MQHEHMCVNSFGHHANARTIHVVRVIFTTDSRTERLSIHVLLTVSSNCHRLTRMYLIQPLPLLLLGRQFFKWSCRVAWNYSLCIGTDTYIYCPCLPKVWLDQAWEHLRRPCLPEVKLDQPWEHLRRAYDNGDRLRKFHAQKATDYCNKGTFHCLM